MSAQIGCFPLEILMSPHCHPVFESEDHWFLSSSSKSNCKWTIVHRFVPLYAIHKNHIEVNAKRTKGQRKKERKKVVCGLSKS